MTGDLQTPGESPSPGDSPAGDAGHPHAGAASSLVVVARLLLLLAAAAALGSAMVLARRHDHAEQLAAGRYTCPMHAEVVSRAPGDCPICGMALEPVREGMPSAMASRAGANDGVATTKRLVLAAQVRAPAWLAADGVVTALLHADDFIGLAPGDRALFFAAASPAVGLEVRRSADEPEPVDASTSKVRFQIGATTHAAARTSADVGLLQIAARARDVLVVPASAVLFSAGGPYVLAASRDGDPFAKRPVEIGRILDSSYAAGVSGDSMGAIVVLSGLSAGERVVTGDTFFLDAERRLRLARGQNEATP